MTRGVPRPTANRPWLRNSKLQTRAAALAGQDRKAHGRGPGKTGPTPAFRTRSFRNSRTLASFRSPFFAGEHNITCPEAAQGMRTWVTQP